jgi:hypothetical protein
MDQKQSTARLIIYITIAMVTAAAAGVTTVDFTDVKQVALFTLAVLGAGLNTARSYIDQTPSRVDDK